MTAIHVRYKSDGYHCEVTALLSSLSVSRTTCRDGTVEHSLMVHGIDVGTLTREESERVTNALMDVLGPEVCPNPPPTPNDAPEVNVMWAIGKGQGGVNGKVPVKEVLSWPKKVCKERGVNWYRLYPRPMVASELPYDTILHVCPTAVLAQCVGVSLSDANNWGFLVAESGREDEVYFVQGYIDQEV